MMSLPELNYDVYYWIIQAVADVSPEGAGDEICVKTLLACCLVNHAWCRLAQPILNQTVVIKTENDLTRRIFAPSNIHHLTSLQSIILHRASGEHFTFNVDTILRTLPNSHLLQSFACYDVARLSESSDEKDRELVGTSHFPPRPLDLDLSGLREALLGSIPFGPNWLSLLQIAPNLRCLILYGCGWYVTSSMGFGISGKT
jgi:hypothetical protein